MITLKKNSLRYKDKDGNMQDSGVLFGHNETDITLTKSGIAADAKATGDELSRLSEEKADKSEIPSLGGYATESYVQEYSQPKGDYLTQHQDISGKQDKTDDNLKTNSKNVVGAINEVNSDLSYYENYVTPQMFGAKGNKTTDDTEAIKAAIATGKDVFFPQGIYKITDTLNVKSGQRIFGAKSAQIRPENCEVVFHLSAGCSIEGFSIKIYGTQSVPNTIKTVFLADDASRTTYFSNISDGTGTTNTLLHARITDMLIWNVASIQYTTTDYTVFDFHSTADATSFYDILVQGCTCINLKTHGYLARVYGVNDGWVSTCVFDRNYSSGFVWHYFFADNDTNIQNSGAGMHSISNCVAQCKTDTNGFVFSTEQNDFNASNNTPWDWSHSLNCRLTPYVISYDISTPFRHIKTAISVGEMIKYDGVKFTPIGHLRADLIQAVNGIPEPRLTYRPIGIGGEKCVRLVTLPDVNFSDFVVIRFSIIDRYGVNEISISKWNNKIYCSQPLTPNHIIGVTSDWKKFYLYKKLNDGSYDNINAEMVVLQYPFANADVGYSSSGNNTASFNQNFTIDIADNISTCVIDEIPEGLIELPIVIKKQLYISDENGNNYSLKIINGQLQVEEATLESFGEEL